ncbi:MAG: LytR C-terminal domain-containing protein [Gemmatimonadales bacterium]
MTIGRLLRSASLIVVIGCTLPHRRSADHLPAEAAFPPLPQHVTVEVLNAGGVPGAARTAALRLRHAGLDVVFIGNAADGRENSDSTRILVRTGDSAGSGRVTAVLGPARVIDAPDSTRLVDLTILVGRQVSSGAKQSR